MFLDTSKEVEQLNEQISIFDQRELITKLQEMRLLKRETFCQSCGHSMNINAYKKTSKGMHGVVVVVYVFRSNTTLQFEQYHFFNICLCL
jgi:hypothetical protein